MARFVFMDRARRLTLVVLLVSHWALVVGASRPHSAAFDEVARLAGGRMGLAIADHGFNPESGLLPQRWAALPLWWVGVEIPEPGSAARRDFGLGGPGSDGAVGPVRIDWPSGRAEVFDVPGIRRVLVVREGEGRPPGEDGRGGGEADP